MYKYLSSIFSHFLTSFLPFLSFFLPFSPFLLLPSFFFFSFFFFVQQQNNSYCDYQHHYNHCNNNKTATGTAPATHMVDPTPGADPLAACLQDVNLPTEIMRQIGQLLDGPSLYSTLRIERRKERVRNGQKTQSDGLCTFSSFFSPFFSFCFAVALFYSSPFLPSTSSLSSLLSSATTDLSHSAFIQLVFQSSAILIQIRPLDSKESKHTPLPFLQGKKTHAYK